MSPAGLERDIGPVAQRGLKAHPLPLTVSFQAVDFHIEIAVGQPLGQ